MSNEKSDRKANEPESEPKKRVIGRPFKKGVINNPHGRPKELRIIKELARQWSEDAILTLASIMNDESLKPISRIQAATALLDRGYGKPSQEIQVKSDGPPGAIPFELLAKNLSAGELIQMRDLIKKAKENSDNPNRKVVIDVPKKDSSKDT